MPFSRVGLLSVVLTVASACSPSPQPRPEAKTAAPRSAGLVFLTREGCATSETMRAHLDEALRTLGRPVDYPVIDQGTLGPNDPRHGYPTPTLLVNDRDMFGLPIPAPPLPEPT